MDLEITVFKYEPADSMAVELDLAFKCRQFCKTSASLIDTF
jgi:hypothetical protein